MERLLPSIHRYFRAGGRYESEDLFTEILAWLLNADTDGRFRRDFAAAFMSSDDDPDLFADAEAASQVTISARSRPDLQLEVGNPPAFLAVECKVDDRLTEDRLHKYHAALETKWRSERAYLGALTPERVHNEVDLDRAEYPFWTRRANWAKVQQVLQNAADREREQLNGAGTELQDAESPASERLAFIVIAEEFLDMLEHEGLVPPPAIEPKRVKELFERKREYHEHVQVLARLLTRAVRKAELREVFNNADLDVWERRNSVSGTNAEANHGQVRIHFRGGSARDSVFFGFRLDEPGRHFGDPRSSPGTPNAEIYICAAVKFESKPSKSYLLADRGEHKRIRKIVARLNGRLAEHREDVGAWVPRSTNYQQIVALKPASAIANLEAVEQVDELAKFYRAFAAGLQKVVVDDPEGGRTSLLRMLGRLGSA